ncbi:MAG: SurA N-terminal domain-containing protein [Desulfobacterales bacterium]|nr:SurA N-terminal domain-containing protein [Desulfobacterales bacterium]
MKSGMLFCRRYGLAMLVWSCMVFCTTAGISAASELVDRIVAVVNDDIILLSELEKQIKPYHERLRSMGYSQEQEMQMLVELRKDMLDNLIDEKITDQQVDRLGISVSQKEIDNALQRVKEIRSLTDEQLRKALSRQGLTMEEYRKQLQEQLLRSKLLDYEIKSKIVVTEADIKRYYETHLAEFGGEKKYHLRTIIMRVPSFADEEEKSRVRQKMEEVYNQLEKGADFAEMARRYSESGLAAEGGDLGLFNLEEIAPQFREVLKGKSAGSYTPVLDTEQGYQIFFIEDIVETPAKALEEVSAEIQNRLYQEQVDEKFSAWLEDLRKNSHIKVIQ